VAHHLTPNELHADNDCSIGDPFMRMHPEIPRTPYHKFQTFTILLGITIGQFKWFLGDFAALNEGEVGSVPFHVRDSVHTSAFFSFPSSRAHFFFAPSNYPFL
jgi:fatty acid desaturase